MGRVTPSTSVETPASVLVVAPHPDDETIGCGGAIRLRIQERRRVEVVFLTSGERGLTCSSDREACTVREAEALAAGEVLGIDRADFLRFPDHRLDENIEACAAALAGLIDSRAPGIIYLPHPGESHPDHAVTAPIVREALAERKARDRPEFWAYEVWSPMERHGWTEDVTPVMPLKLQAIACYRSQLALLGYDRAVRGLNRYRGLMAAGSEYAEAFRYLPWRAASARAVARGRKASPT